jgi:hypothetical protein
MKRNVFKNIAKAVSIALAFLSISKSKSQTFRFNNFNQKSSPHQGDISASERTI